VVDPGVLISGVITPLGPSASLLRAVRAGDLTLIASPLLLTELGTVLGRPKFRRYLSVEEAESFVGGVRFVCEWVADPEERSVATRDPKDDYLVALASSSRADALVSGDRDLLAVKELPVLTPREALDLARRR
jgi:uncharacterized protein